MSLSAKVASALSFAHLAGLGRGKAKAEDNDDKKDRDHEDVNDGAKKGKNAEDDEPEKDDKDKKDPETSAEDDDPDANAEGDDPEHNDGDEDDDGDKKGKKAKADDYGDDDEKMKAGAKKERARCAAIFASPAAARNVALAAELAFNTDLSATQATAILAKTPAAAGNSTRAAGNPRVGVGASTEVTGKHAIDSGWDRAFAKVNPQKRK
jgi:hypothetical protein